MKEINGQQYTTLEDLEKENIPKIELIDWWDNDKCGDGCCGDWGTKLIVNGEEVSEYFMVEPSEVKMLLDALNVKYILQVKDELQEEATKEFEAFLGEDL